MTLGVSNLQLDGNIFGNSVSVEIGRLPSRSISLGDAAVRALATVPTGAIGFSNLQGKGSSAVAYGIYLINAPVTSAFLNITGWVGNTGAGSETETYSLPSNLLSANFNLIRVYRNNLVANNNVIYLMGPNSFSRIAWQPSPVSTFNRTFTFNGSSLLGINAAGFSATFNINFTNFDTVTGAGLLQGRSIIVSKVAGAQPKIWVLDLNATTGNGSFSGLRGSIGFDAVNQVAVLADGSRFWATSDQASNQLSYWSSSTGEAYTRTSVVFTGDGLSGIEINAAQSALIACGRTNLAQGWPITAGVLGTQYSAPATQITNNGSDGDCAFNPAGNVAFFVCNVSPFIFAYNFSAATGFGAKFADPASVAAAGSPKKIMVHPGGIAVGYTTNTGLVMYAWSAAGFGARLTTFGQTQQILDFDFGSIL